jgi:2-amino-4-hydroxy-6-hydroxymethyldihydropteridine diphosphokinase
MSDLNADAYVALGANLGQPEATLRDALAELGRLPGTRLAACSSLYHSAPVGGPAQPHYFNAVARLETSLSPPELLTALLELERRHGRIRGVPNAPRTLDLDLLLYDANIVHTPTLTLPHPRMHLRRFVLAPLLEIAPDCVIPGLGPARDWLARSLDQPVERLPS